MNNALNQIVENGDTFKVLNFNLEVEHQSTSAAEVRGSAPCYEIIEKLSQG